jgi:hypothetical protein
MSNPQAESGVMPAICIVNLTSDEAGCHFCGAPTGLHCGYGVPVNCERAAR